MSDFSETQPMTSMVVLVDPTYEEPEDNETKVLERSVTLTNEQWSILALCAEAYATTFRTQQSEFIATYVTRNQLDEAVTQASKMNSMLQKLDKLQAKLV
jgi:2-C-methyl-D-erythritol 4-phosphate cytidylyltransferase